MVKNDDFSLLDSLGAEKLLGRGDMLFSSVSLTKPKRIQGALITDQEIKRIVSYIKEKSGGPNYITEIVERQKVRGVAGVGMDGGSNDDDELFQEAKELIINSGKASASFLQRRLSIGYARAARLLDILEESGIIGPSNGAKAREIMVSKEQYEAMIEDGVAGARLHDQATAQAPDNYLGDDGEKPEGESEDDDSSDSDEEVNDDSGDKKLSNSTVDDEGEVPEFMSENPDGYEGEDEDIVPTSSPVEKKSEKGPEKDSDNSNFERYFSR